MPTHPANARELTHALSFDIEDWFHMVEVRAVRDPSRWPQLSERSGLVERYTDRVLEMCESAGVRATFFILGWIADRHRSLVGRIASAGHELGTHSFWHRTVYDMTPEQFRRDLDESVAAIGAAAPGVPVRGFRAPSFSITPGAEWAFDVLLDAGIAYDASLFPAARGHGGYPCPRGAHELAAPSGRRLPELPMSVARVPPLPRPICYSGGGYLRLLPMRAISAGIAAEAASGRPTVVYLHPRDLAPDCPRVAMPPHRRFKCYVGLGTTEGKLARLLADYAWGPCGEVLDAQLAKDARTAPTPRPTGAPA